MLQRIFAMLIVGFWLAMTGLLVVREVFPEATDLNRVPVHYVTGLFFQHRQSSDLSVYDAGREVGDIHIQPRASADKKTRMLEFQGAVTLNPLGMAKQRIIWNSTFVMNDRNEIRHLHAKISTSSPLTVLTLTVDPEANRADFEVQSKEVLLDKSSITLDREGLMKLVGRLGIEPVALQQVLSSGAATPPPEITAYQSSTTLNGETVATYLMSMKLSGQTLVDAHVSQLGQVLRAEIPLLGYKLAPPNVTP